MPSTRDDSRPIAAVLDSLIRMHARVEGKEDLSSQEVAAAIRAEGGNISHTTIWKLRTGQETNPRIETLGLLAQHFGVSVKYFFDEQYADTVSRQLKLLGAVRDGKLLGVAARLGELSQAGQDAIVNVIEQVLDDERKGRSLDA
ncbi:helix-turn-helix domain-containing protein [Streptomyces cacaoi]|uniref:helix-turn-helix domain-containing protein n=1 Tax=Streptomyces cacaoi TaxID=1898 RepID=UPI0037497838